MTDQEAKEWLSVAAKRLAEYPPEIVAKSCFLAQGQCSHYSQILPNVVAHCEAAHKEHLRLQATRDRWQSPVLSLGKPSISEEDFERIVAERGLALSCALDDGRIIRTENGFERA